VNKLDEQKLTKDEVHRESRSGSAWQTWMA